MTEIAYSANDIRPLAGAEVHPDFTLSEAANNGQPVVLTATAKTVELTDTDIDQAYGLVMGGGRYHSRGAHVSGDSVGVLRRGRVTGFSGLTPGSLVYISGTEGRLDDAGVVAVGMAIDATTIDFDFAATSIGS